MDIDNNSLMISSIQHFLFCRRQWALIHLEQIWTENFFTVDGSVFHSKAHDGLQSEKRNGLIISRGMPISSTEHGIHGVCDVVEFKECTDGIKLYGLEKKYSVCPVEYKRGKTKESKADIFQLVAQALCLEEMLCTNIDYGYLYYGESKRRFGVEFTDNLRSEVIETIKEMQKLYQEKRTPKASKKAACSSCSLKDSCMPKLKKSAVEYLNSVRKEGL